MTITKFLHTLQCVHIIEKDLVLYCDTVITNEKYLVLYNLTMCTSKDESYLLFLDKLKWRVPGWSVILSSGKFIVLFFLLCE